MASLIVVIWLCKSISKCSESVFLFKMGRVEFIYCCGDSVFVHFRTGSSPIWVVFCFVLVVFIVVIIFARAFQSVLSLLKTWKPCISKLGLVPFELKLWHSATPPFTYILNWNKNVLLLKHFLYFETNYIRDNGILNAVKRLWEGGSPHFLEGT